MKINVFDTETVDGIAVLIASRDRSAWVKSWRECMDFLFSHKENVWFAYNLDYDFQALLKYLKRREIEHLWVHGRTEHRGIEIEYIRGKYAGFTRKIKKGKREVKRTLQCYDLCQFYNMRLDDAAKTFLGVRKRSMPKYIISDLGRYLSVSGISERVRKYCERDSEITARLAGLLLQYLGMAGIAVKKFFSYGYIAKQVIKGKVGRFRLPWSQEQFIRRCYYGGRIECLQRGFFKKAYIYDLVSAYPSIIRNLPDLTGCSIREELKPAGDFSFVECKITMPEKPAIGPLACRSKNKPLCYPDPTGRVITTTYKEIKTVKRHFPKAKIEYKRCLNFYLASDRKPFKKIIDDMFEKRYRGNAAEKYLYKIILNSIYGAFGEQKPKYRSMTAGEQHYQYRRDSKRILADAALDTYGVGKHQYWECSCDQCKKYRGYVRGLGIRGRDIHVVETRDGPFKRVKKPGRNYNIVYFSLITSGIRDAVLDAGLVNIAHEPLLFLTDGIPFKTRLKPSELDLGDRMGQWAYKGMARDMCIVGAGVYEYDTVKDGKPVTVTKFRGFDTRWSLRKKLKRCTRRTKIKIQSLQNVSLGLVCKQTKAFTLEDFNKLLKKEKNLDVNFDTKRKWPRPFGSAAECLKINQSSEVKT